MLKKNILDFFKDYSNINRNQGIKTLYSGFGIVITCAAPY